MIHISKTKTLFRDWRSSLDKLKKQEYILDLLSFNSETSIDAFLQYLYKNMIQLFDEELQKELNTFYYWNFNKLHSINKNIYSNTKWYPLFDKIIAALSLKICLFFELCELSLNYNNFSQNLMIAFFLYYMKKSDKDIFKSLSSDEQLLKLKPIIDYNQLLIKIISENYNKLYVNNIYLNIVYNEILLNNNDIIAQKNKNNMILSLSQSIHLLFDVLGDETLLFDPFAVIFTFVRILGSYEYSLKLTHTPEEFDYYQQILQKYTNILLNNNKLLITGQADALLLNFDMLLDYSLLLTKIKRCSITYSHAFELLNLHKNHNFNDLTMYKESKSYTIKLILLSIPSVLNIMKNKKTLPNLLFYLVVMYLNALMSNSIILYTNHINSICYTNYNKNNTNKNKINNTNNNINNNTNNKIYYYTLNAITNISLGLFNGYRISKCLKSTYPNKFDNLHHYYQYNKTYSKILSLSLLTNSFVFYYLGKPYDESNISKN